MFLKPSKKLFYSSAVLIVLAITAVVIYPSDPIDYNTEVKPILNKKCITCHGGVKQEGGFSLLFEEEAFSDLSVLKGTRRNPRLAIYSV